MPHLRWLTKSLPDPHPEELHTDSLVFPRGNGYPAAPAENRLILGDNLAVMDSLLAKYAGTVDLIYADPPFFTNKHYRARVGRGEDSRKPAEWRLAEGYPDDWPDVDAYLDMLYPRLECMHRLLAPHGSMYLHLDWHASAYARLLMDEIFGVDRLLNEIVWVYHGPSPIRSAFNRKHDTILAYTKSSDYTFNIDDVREPYNPSTVKTFASSRKAGFGKIPDLKRGKVPEDWWYFPVVARLHSERTGYPTQKPEALLERIILASSNPGDLVADFFCGSGTTALVAERLGRSFLAADRAWRAVHTTRVRLAEHSGIPFRCERTESALLPPDWNHGIQATVKDACISLAGPNLEQLDYWEVDPNWKGEGFHSAVQAGRPRNKGEVPYKLALPEHTEIGRIALRMVSIEGKRGFLEVR